MANPGELAATRLQKVAKEGQRLQTEDSAAVTAWRTTAEASLVDALGEQHTFVKRFRDVVWHYKGGLSAIGRDPFAMASELQKVAIEANQIARRRGCQASCAIIEAAAKYVADMP